MRKFFRHLSKRKKLQLGIALGVILVLGITFVALQQRFKFFAEGQNYIDNTANLSYTNSQGTLVQVTSNTVRTTIVMPKTISGTVTMRDGSNFTGTVSVCHYTNDNFWDECYSAANDLTGPFSGGTFGFTDAFSTGLYAVKITPTNPNMMEEKRYLNVTAGQTYNLTPVTVRELPISWGIVNYNGWDLPSGRPHILAGATCSFKNSTGQVVGDTLTSGEDGTYRLYSENFGTGKLQYGQTYSVECSKASYIQTGIQPEVNSPVQIHPQSPPTELWPFWVTMDDGWNWIRPYNQLKVEVVDINGNPTHAKVLMRRLANGRYDFGGGAMYHMPGDEISLQAFGYPEYGTASQSSDVVTVIPRPHEGELFNRPADVVLQLKNPSASISGNVDYSACTYQNYMAELLDANQGDKPIFSTGYGLMYSFVFNYEISTGSYKVRISAYGCNSYTSSAIAISSPTDTRNLGTIALTRSSGSGTALTSTASVLPTTLTSTQTISSANPELTDTQTISGTVNDNNRRTNADATVTILDGQTPVAETKSDSLGNYRATSDKIQPDKQYTVQVSKDGSKISESQVTVKKDTKTTADVTLKKQNIFQRIWSFIKRLFKRGE